MYLLCADMHAFKVYMEELALIKDVISSSSSIKS